MNNNHQRKSIRLKGYDYSQAGLYFITICTQNQIQLFGDATVGAPLVGALDHGQAQNGHPQGVPLQRIVEHMAELGLSDAGKMVASQWMDLLQRFHGIQLHEYVVMPNHFHGIVEISSVETKAGTRPAPMSIGDVVGAFKSLTTHAYIQGVKQLGWPTFNKKLWQRNYWEHIIRNEQEYHRIAQYILDNPAQWQHDQLNPRRGTPCGCPDSCGSPDTTVRESEAEYGKEVWMV
ncbi:MAG: transposase [Zetaproteobacteria bacterium]|nr:transposase [Zetaproteobacteria bacterium]